MRAGKYVLKTGCVTVNLYLWMSLFVEIEEDWLLNTVHLDAQDYRYPS